MGSNGIDKLMAQMLATKLNIANGAPVTPKLTAALAAADAFLMTYDADDWSSLSKAEQKAVLSWMTKFDDFNNGY
jgi:roadblock/LC7 domain-containing protein